MGHNRINILFLFLFIIFTWKVNGQVNFTSSNLPIVKIQTNGQQIPEDVKITADMKIIYHGPGEINHVNDDEFDYDGFVGIEIRGNTSLSYPKKSYSFETRDESGGNLNVSLVDLPEENDWVLYAPYSDKSLMRNVLTYELSRQLGWYAPRTRFCEVLLNDDYIGVYVLIERIKRDENRVDISKLTDNDTIGDEVSGGYILQVDRHEGGGWFSGINNHIFFQYSYPKEEDILQAQKNYIFTRINSFEEFLYSFDEGQLDSLGNTMNIDNFIDFILINELAKNVDAYRLSTYIHKDKDSKDPRIHVGPVWDYNLSYGNFEDYYAYDPEGFVYSDPTFHPYTLFWFRKLMGFEFFRDSVEERWEYLHENELSKNSMYAIIDSVAILLEDAQDRNFQQWDILGQYIWPNYYIGDTYEEEVSILKNWLNARQSWINEEFTGLPETFENGFYEDKKIIVYPVPTDDIINIRFLDNPLKSIEFYLYDYQGKNVFTHREKNAANVSGSVRIDLSRQNLHPGIFIYRCFLNGESVVSGKLVKM